MKVKWLIFTVKDVIFHLTINLIVMSNFLCNYFLPHHWKLSYEVYGAFMTKREVSRTENKFSFRAFWDSFYSFTVNIFLWRLKAVFEDLEWIFPCSWLTCILLCFMRFHFSLLKSVTIIQIQQVNDELLIKISQTKACKITQKYSIESKKKTENEKVENQEVKSAWTPFIHCFKIPPLMDSLFSCNARN